MGRSQRSPWLPLARSWRWRQSTPSCTQFIYMHNMFLFYVPILSSDSKSDPSYMLQDQITVIKDFSSTILSDLVVLLGQYSVICSLASFLVCPLFIDGGWSAGTRSLQSTFCEVQLLECLNMCEQDPRLGWQEIWSVRQHVLNPKFVGKGIRVYDTK